MKNKNFFIISFLIAIFFAILVIKSLGFSDKALNYPVDFQVKKGEGFTEIANDLYSKKLISSKASFELMAVLGGFAHRFKVGFYEFDKPMNSFEIANLLAEGPKEVSVVIFPGMTLKEADDELARLHIINKNDLVNFKNYSDRIKKDIGEEPKSLEGFVFPDTYRFYQGTDINFVVDKILDNFENKALTYLKGGDNILETLTIASYLEKEVLDYGDRQIVAAIFKKRLELGMPLDIDATVIYAKCNGRYLNCPALLQQDYKIDSPFNTYLHKGLTPAPISNPSLDSILATINFKDKGYLYYLSDPKTKKTIFSVNLNDHSNKRAIYLKK